MIKIVKLVELHTKYVTVFMNTSILKLNTNVSVLIKIIIKSLIKIKGTIF